VSILPTDAAARNEFPMADGLLYYFPAALAAVANVSKLGNDQHNPGEPMHWARGKSTDHENKIMRHLLEAGTKDKDGTRHSAKVAWRALALLQEELEREEGAPLPRNARLPKKEVNKLNKEVTKPNAYEPYPGDPIDRGHFARYTVVHSSPPNCT
jgi:hypothetical protein